MKIENLKELQKVIQLCRKTGVESIKIDNVEFHLGKAPVKSTKSVIDTDTFPEASIKVPQFTGPMSDDKDDIKTEQLSEEQLLMWSAGASNEHVGQ